MVPVLKRRHCFRQSGGDRIETSLAIFKVKSLYMLLRAKWSTFHASFFFFWEGGQSQRKREMRGIHQDLKVGNVGGERNYIWWLWVGKLWWEWVIIEGDEEETRSKLQISMDIEENHTREWRRWSRSVRKWRYTKKWTKVDLIIKKKETPNKLVCDLVHVMVAEVKVMWL